MALQELAAALVASLSLAKLRTHVPERKGRGTMAAERDAERAILSELASRPLSWAGYAVEEVNAGARNLEAQGRVIIGRETDGRPPEYDFSFVSRAT